MLCGEDVAYLCNSDQSIFKKAHKLVNVEGPSATSDATVERGLLRDARSEFDVREWSSEGSSRQRILCDPCCLIRPCMGVMKGASVLRFGNAWDRPDWWL